MVKRKNIDSDITDTVKKYIKYLKSKGVKIEKAIIFGSYARGNNRDESDIDVCLISDKFGRDEVGWLQRLLYETGKIDDRIEPVPVSRSDFERNATPFITEIKKYGHPISA